MAPPGNTVQDEAMAADGLPTLAAAGDRPRWYPEPVAITPGAQAPRCSSADGR
jgi:hypothetical protein